MVLCCLIPLAVIGVLWAAGVSSAFLFLGVALLCPVLHIVMMLGMKKQGSDNEKLIHH